MSDQLPMFEQMTSPNTLSATSSPESVSGPTRSVKRDGPMTAKSGPAPVPVNPSVRPAKAKRSTTTGTFGQSSFVSSKHEDLSFALASRLRPLTDSLGSTLFNLTWMTRATPAGRSISALRASEPLTEGSVFIGWPTPQKHDERERGNTMADHHYFPHDLSNMAVLAAWPTPVANDDNKTPEAHLAMKTRMGERDGTGANRTAITSLQVMAQLSGWKTPCVPNGGRISGNQTDIGKHQDGTKAQIGLENEAKLSGWTTPTSTERSGQGPANESLTLDARLASWATPKVASGDYQNSGTEKILNLQGQVRLTAFGETPIGYLLGPNGWEIVPASGQLNAEHSRWLMGLPHVWDDCGVTAMASSRKRRKPS